MGDTDNSDEATRKANEEAARAERQRDLDRVAAENDRKRRHAEGEQNR